MESSNKAAGTEKPGAKPLFEAADLDPYMLKDPEAMARNVARALEHLGKAASAWLEPRETGERKDAAITPLTEVVKTLGRVAEYWMADPKRSLAAQTELLTSFMGLWLRSMQKLQGEEPVEAEAESAAAATATADKRFTDRDWARNPFFDFLRQAYLVTSGWAEKMVGEAEDLDPHTRMKAAFYVKQISAALSPSNFLLTNPQLYRETIAASGENLVRGMAMLAEDVAAGHGELRLRQTDMTKFAVGRDLAVTPGKVVAENDLCQILQYSPTTTEVFKRPLLICPPWINKYYVLDLTPEKSFIRWCVEQGHTVFVISWVNPDERHADKDWVSYAHDGIDFALDMIEQATGERDVNAIGYCVGGTLLAATLALHAKRKDRRIRSATFFTTQVDFELAGELKVFVDEEQLAVLEAHMHERGYLEGSRMAAAFNMLRASELIWPFVVNNYLKGEQPRAFDLLYWNADSTRLPAANQTFYLRNCYLENRLSQGRMVLDNQRISLKDVKIPIYNLATREDHIAPARSVFRGNACFGGKVEFVLAGSGHIAGVVNPPDKQKYQYWTGEGGIRDFDTWLAGAQEHKGSWWPHWQTWIESKSRQKAPARVPGGAQLPAIEEAPGRYVMERA